MKCKHLQGIPVSHSAMTRLLITQSLPFMCSLCVQFRFQACEHNPVTSEFYLNIISECSKIGETKEVNCRFSGSNPVSACLEQLL